MTKSIDEAVTEVAGNEAETVAVETTAGMAADIAGALPDTTTDVDVHTSSAAADVGASLDLSDKYRAIAREEAMKAVDEDRRLREAIETETVSEPEPTIVVVAPEPEPEPVAADTGEIFPDTAPVSDEPPPKTHPYYRPLRRGRG